MSITPLTRITDLSLSVAAHDAIMADNIIFVGDLCQKTRAEFLQQTDEATVGEIEAVLASHGLSLGTIDPAWPPESIEVALAA